MRAAQALAAGLVALALFAPRPSEACAVCSSSDALEQAGTSAEPAGALRFRLEGEALDSDMRMAADMTMSMAQQTVRPVVVFNPADGLSLALQLPFARKDTTMHLMNDEMQHVSSGLADIDLGARWFAWTRVSLGEDLRQDLAFTAGATVPTGENDEVDDLGMRLDEYAQRGTGAFGPYVGALYALHLQDWLLTGSASGRVHTQNAHGFRYGGMVMAGANAERRFGAVVSLGLGLDGCWSAHDVSAGSVQENSGGLLLSLAPSATFALSRSVSVQARALVPVAHHLYGDQRVGPTFTAGLEYAFH